MPILPENLASSTIAELAREIRRLWGTPTPRADMWLRVMEKMEGVVELPKPTELDGRWYAVYEFYLAARSPFQQKGSREVMWHVKERLGELPRKE